MKPPPPSGATLPPSLKGAVVFTGSPCIPWEREDNSERRASKSEERVRSLESGRERNNGETHYQMWQLSQNVHSV